MINDDIQTQKGGAGSTNLQAKNIVVKNGMTYSEVKEVALDIYRSNALALSAAAAEIASERVEEITNHFLLKLSESAPSAFAHMAQPSMQSALFDAQKQYAKTGDKDLQSLLVDILVQRASSPERDICQIVLDEALTVAGKLTETQTDMLALNFSIALTEKNQLSTLVGFEQYLRKEILPFYSLTPEKSFEVEHLSYAGCVTILETTYYQPVEMMLKNRYVAFFSKGFSSDVFTSTIGEISQFSKILMRSFHDPDLIQFSANRRSVLDIQIEQLGIDSEKKNAIISLYTSNIMSDEEAKKVMVSLVPEVEGLLNSWVNGKISKMTLTPVGIAIAIANINKKINLRLNLKKWL